MSLFKFKHVRVKAFLNWAAVHSGKEAIRDAKVATVKGVIDLCDLWEARDGFVVFYYDETGRKFQSADEATRYLGKVWTHRFVLIAVLFALAFAAMAFQLHVGAVGFSPAPGDPAGVISISVNSGYNILFYTSLEFPWPIQYFLLDVGFPQGWPNVLFTRQPY